jgi:alkylhydroperoxidase family enzyme
MTLPFGTLEEREAEVLGQPPRIPPQDRAEYEHKVRDATRALRAEIVRDERELTLDAIPEIMFTLCHHPDLWGKIMALSLQMQGDTGVLPPRDRQLAILRTGWLLQAPYEWGQHVQWSKLVGITSEEIERVTEGSTAPSWTEHERAVLLAAEELRDRAMVSDATWATLAKQLDDRQLFELLALIGQFTTIAYVQNGLRLRLEPGNAGLAAR